eukprot:7857-Heterococcus_DN1.PRE.2
MLQASKKDHCLCSVSEAVVAATVNGKYEAIAAMRGSRWVILCLVWQLRQQYTSDDTQGTKGDAKRE